eukprot:CAMPEP_0114695482 /NCGR_PEP_ID=MMETSP0191-20121206/71400_1 /TAXON_ID=126664 /ORGANISM="Sorites sp." /LENGTH=119 /DNA_ID=CAMNT_0001991765 /DNA_START=70 /DNA_END=427 /DNA_ORIENTATION=-
MASRGSMFGGRSAGRASVFSSKSKASGPVSPNSSVSGHKSRRSKGTKDSGGQGGSKASSDDYLIPRETNSSDKFIVGVIGASLMTVQVVILIIGLTSWLKVVNTELAEQLMKAGVSDDD